MPDATLQGLTGGIGPGQFWVIAARLEAGQDLGVGLVRDQRVQGRLGGGVHLVRNDQNIRSPSGSTR